jgi:hypothetical protein
LNYQGRYFLILNVKLFSNYQRLETVLSWGLLLFPAIVSFIRLSARQGAREQLRRLSGQLASARSDD